jgi:hypothetical protein
MRKYFLLIFVLCGFSLNASRQADGAPASHAKAAPSGESSPGAGAPVAAETKAPSSAAADAEPSVASMTSASFAPVQDMKEFIERYRLDINDKIHKNIKDEKLETLLGASQDEFKKIAEQLELGCNTNAIYGAVGLEKFFAQYQKATGRPYTSPSSIEQIKERSGMLKAATDPLSVRLEATLNDTQNFLIQSKIIPSSEMVDPTSKEMSIDYFLFLAIHAKKDNRFDSADIELAALVEHLALEWRLNNAAPLLTEFQAAAAKGRYSEELGMFWMLKQRWLTALGMGQY